MTPKISRFIKYFISFSISILFLYLAFVNIKFDELKKILLDINIIWAIIFFLCINISHFVRAWRWIYLLKPLKDNVKISNSFKAVNVGFAINNIIPRGGELVRPYSIFRTEGVSTTSAFSTVVIERLLDSATFFLLAWFSFIIEPKALNILFPFLKDYNSQFSILMLLLMLIFFIVIYKFEKIILILNNITHLLPKKLADLFNKLVQKLAAGAKVTWQSNDGGKILFLSLILWVFQVFEMYLIFYAFSDFPAEHLVYQTAVVLLVASSVAYMLPTPSGIGTYHTIIPFVLVTLYGVNNVTAVGYAVFTHSIGYLTTSAIGGYYFIKQKLHLSKELIEKEK